MPDDNADGADSGYVSTAPAKPESQAPLGPGSGLPGTTSVETSCLPDMELLEADSRSAVGMRFRKGNLVSRLRDLLLQRVERVIAVPLADERRHILPRFDADQRRIVKLVNSWDALSRKVFTLYRVYAFDAPKIAASLGVSESLVVKTLESIPRRIYTGLSAGSSVRGWLRDTVRRTRP